MRGRDFTAFTLTALRAQRQRALLTVTGIAIGVAAVVLLTAIGEGIRRFVLAEFSQFGTHLIAVTPGKTSTLGMSGALISNVRPLSLSDAQALARLPSVEAVVPMVQGNAAVEGGGHSRRTTLFGVGAQVPQVWQMQPAIGRFLPAGESGHARAFAVLGATLQRELFGDRSPLGERLRVGGEPYRVLGVMAPKGQMLGFDLDDLVFIPISRALALFDRVSLMEIDLLYAVEASGSAVAERIRALLKRRHGREDFTITTQDQMLAVLGSVLSVESRDQAKKEPQDVRLDDERNRRLTIKSLPAPVLSSLRWPGRPTLPGGNLAWTYMIRYPHGEFALFVGQVENGRSHPFEVWVNGAEQPRGLGAVAKTLSMDMRADDRAWLTLKLDVLSKTFGDPFELPFPPHGELKKVPGIVAAVAQVVRFRCEQLGAFEEPGPTPVLDAMFSVQEPKTGTDGTLSWTVDIQNPGSGDDFVLGLKEITLPPQDGFPVGVTRPYSMWLSGHYPRALDGLSRILSLDMRVMDPAWIGMKLRKLTNYSEPLGDFMAFVPGERRQENFPSIVAYMARVIIHRYAMLGVLDENGYPAREMGILEAPREPNEPKLMQGALCNECGNYAVIKKDGCDFCTACGAVGSCG